MKRLFLLLTVLSMIWADGGDAPTESATQNLTFLSPCIDIDADGYGNPGSSSCPNGPEEDCNDDDWDVYPGATELCDGQDNDCNAATPDGADECLGGYSCEDVASVFACTDIDECLAGTDTCDANATCTNTDGSYLCECEPGYAGDGNTCSACPVGTYQALSGQLTCVECPLGTANPLPGQTECLACTPGTFAGVTGMEACSPCNAGFYSQNYGSAACTACPFGKFQDLPGQAVCIACPVGRANPLEGQTECAACDPGTFADNEGSLFCSDCPAGSFSADFGSAACSPCPQGRYQDLPGQTVCIDCPMGRANPLVGQSECALCDPGTFAGVEGLAACSDCDPGFYAALSGAAECSACEEGSYQDLSGQAECIACPIGKANPLQGQIACEDCLADTYADQEGQLTCSDCPSNASSDPGAAVCDCNAFFLDIEPGPDVVCEADADSDGYTVSNDCDDGNDNVYPGAADLFCDGIDQDCSTTDFCDGGCDAGDTGLGTDCDGNCDAGEEYTVDCANVAKVSGPWSEPGTWDDGIVPNDGGQPAVIQAGSAVTLDIDATVQDLVIDGALEGGDGSRAGFTIFITGDLIINGTYSHGSGNMEFIGPGHQEIKGTAVSSAFYDLTANNPGGEITLLTYPCTVAGALTLTAGNFITGSQSLTIEAAGSATAGSSISYVDGPLRRATASTAEYLFPTGDNPYGAAAIIPADASPAVFEVEYHHTTHSNATAGGTLLLRSSAEYWDVNRISGTTDLVSLKLFWGTHSSLAGQGISLADLTVAAYDDPSAWLESGRIDFDGDLSGVGWARTFPPMLNTSYTFGKGSILVNDPVEVPITFALTNIHPNPFNPVTTIEYTLPDRMDINLQVYNMQGRLVATLTTGVQDIGNHSIQWDGRSQPSGMYIVQLISPRAVVSKKVMLLK